MEEHRYSCPSQVREFTRYRAHVDFSQDRPAPASPVLQDGSDPASAPGEQLARGPGAAESSPAR
jgi:hypothetical protein